MKWEKNTALENLFGAIKVCMREIFKIIIYMDMEYINGLMEEDMKVNGKIIKWTVMERVLILLG